MRKTILLSLIVCLTAGIVSAAAVWSEDFESSSFTAGGWSTTGTATVATRAAYSGTYGAKLAKTASIETAIDTTGFTSIHVKYRRQTAGLDAGEDLVVEWYDGSSWNTLESIEDCRYSDGLQDKTCGAGADDNASFKIRFSTSANKNNESAFIDDIEVTGTSATPDTDPPTPNPAVFASAPAAISDTAISMTATAGSDASGPVEYLFTETSGNPGSTSSSWQTSVSYTDSGLDADTQYTYTVTMRDGLGNAGAASSGASATTDPQGDDTDDTANADITVAGTVFGSYVDTQASDNGYQSITERESGGKPANRYSYLEHKWTINVTGGNAVTFYVEAYQSASSDGDNFTFAYSTDDSSYTDMVTVTKTSDDDSYQGYTMPAALSGTVYIRVMDTDATSGNRNLDTINIDDMFIRSVAGPPDTDPPTPDPMTWATAPYSTGSSSIAMVATTASDASPVEYYFTATDGGNDSGWQDSTTYNDTGLAPETLYSYTVTARDKSAAQNATAASSAASATTDPQGSFDPIFINFQPAASPVPSGYLVDGGDTYGDRGNGYSYGWDGNNNETRDRGAHADQRYDTLNHFQKSGDATWEIEIPNGTYDINVVFGDSGNIDQTNDVSVENVDLLDPDGQDNFDEYFGISVVVSDGRLTLSPLGGASNAKVCYIDIYVYESDPPTPNPAAFASAPAADSETAISMTATTGSDASGPVKYLFTETSGNPGGNDSGWQTSTSYTDTGLAASTQYTYTVTMRDGLGNTGAASSGASATTDADIDPPTPDPATFAIAPTADSDIAISMTATTGSDATGPVEYYFDETSGNLGGSDSGWQTSAGYTDSGLELTTQYCYTVQMRDSAIPAHVGTASAPYCATTLGLHVLVPDVTGQDQATAESNIIAAGFLVGTVTMSYSATVPPGDVISQNPVGGTMIFEGSSVDIIVSLNDVPLNLTVEQITFGTKHRLFGYIGQSLTIPWNASERYIVAMESDFHDHSPGADEAARIILIDTQNGYSIEYLDETRAWNIQQGTMLYWNPGSPETQIFFNDRDPATQKIFTVLYDIETRQRVREYRFEDTPIGNSGVASKGGWFLAINYARMDRLRPVTGYVDAYDWTVGVQEPLDDGIFKVNIETGEKELLVNFQVLANLCNQHTVSYYINHTLWNRANDKIWFFARGAEGGSTMKVNKALSMNSDGTNAKVETFIGGHPEWDLGDVMIGRVGNEQVRYDVVTENIIGSIGGPGTFINPEGDISLSPNGLMFVNGNPTNCYQIYRRADGELVTSSDFDRGPYSSGILRIDPAPRWNRMGNKLLVPGWINNARQLFIITVEGAEAGPEAE